MQHIPSMTYQTGAVSPIPSTLTAPQPPYQPSSPPRPPAPHTSPPASTSQPSPTPLHDVQQTQNSFTVHPSRLSNDKTIASSPPPAFSPQLIVPSPPQHIIIGDSMVKGLQVPNTIHICKGGIHPKQVLPLLPSSDDILPPDSYDHVRTVTLIVGTNALNVASHSKPIPLLEVISDYSALVTDLRKLFPNARLGLLNVIPRVYTCRETLFRIEMFNSLFSRHITEIVPGVIWIRLYWEFVNEYGYLRQDLYGKNGLHLNFKGKKLMSSSIVNFQESFY